MSVERTMYEEWVHKFHRWDN